MKEDGNDSDEVNQEILQRRMNRRRAISTGAKVGIAAGVAAVVAGVGGYLGGSASVPPSIPAQTITQTVTAAERTITQTQTSTTTVTAPATTVTRTVTFTPTLLTSEVAVEAAKKNFSNVKVTYAVESGFDEKELTFFANEWKGLTGMTVEILPLPTFAVREKVISEGIAKTGAIDMLNTFPMWYPDLVDGGFLYPLDEFIATYKPDLTDFMFFDFYAYHNPRTNKVYGMPIDLDDFILYYRKDLFEDEGERRAFKDRFGRELRPPDTWEEFIEISSFFKRAKGEKLAGQTLEKDFGGHLEFRARGGVFWWFINRMASYGARYFRKTENDLIPAINSPAAVKALEDMMEATQYGIPAAASVAWGEVIGAFEAGDAAMNIFWPMLGKHAQFTEGSQVVDKLGYAVMPGVRYGDGIYRRSAWAAGKSISVTTDSRNKEAAYLFAQWITSPEVLLRVSSWHQPEALGALDPIRSRIFTAGEFEKEYGATWLGSGEYLKAHRENALIGFPDLQILGTMEYFDALDAELSDAITGKKTAQQALDDAAATWDEITDKFGRKKQWEYYDPNIYELGFAR